MRKEDGPGPLLVFKDRLFPSVQAHERNFHLVARLADAALQALRGGSIRVAAPRTKVADHTKKK